MTKQEQSYYSAFELVVWIDNHLVNQTRHFRNKSGLLLTTLEQVVQAILADELVCTVP